MERSLWYSNWKRQFTRVYMYIHIYTEYDLLWIKEYTNAHFTLWICMKNIRKNTDQTLNSGSISGEWRGNFYFTYLVKSGYWKSDFYNKNQLRVNSVFILGCRAHRLFCLKCCFKNYVPLIFPKYVILPKKPISFQSLKVTHTWQR